MWHDIGIAFSLLLVVEGIMPFLLPGRWRKVVRYIAHFHDTTLRLMGLICMVAGTILLYLIN